MKFFNVAALLIVFSISASAADYVVDPVHSNVTFTVRHLISKVTGNFTDFTGEFSWNEKTPAASKVNFVVQTKSLDTNNEKRDTHLRSPDFFDAEKYPTLTFASKKVQMNGKKNGKVSGDLTIRGVTKPTTFDVEYLGTSPDPFGGAPRAGFIAKTRLNRKDYGLVWNKTLDNGAFLLGDDVDVNLQIEAQQKK